MKDGFAKKTDEVATDACFTLLYLLFFPSNLGKQKDIKLSNVLEIISLSKLIDFWCSGCDRVRAAWPLAEKQQHYYY
jgi:hypothetical protein